MNAVAVQDACVLYPPSLRDLLMRAAVAGLYAPRWTEQIHEEWTRNVLADNPQVSAAQLDRTRRLMNQAVPKSIVLGYEALIPALSLPDAEDRHVLAAALQAKARLIVTFNLSDFPAAVLRPCGVQAVHPDPFLNGLLDERPDLFLQTVQAHRTSLHRPPKNPGEYLQTLKANGLKELARRLEDTIDRI